MQGSWTERARSRPWPAGNRAEMAVGYFRARTRHWPPSTCCIIRNLGFHIDFFPWKPHKMDSEGIRSRHGQAPPVPDTSYGWAMDGSESDDEHVVDASIPSTPFEQDFDAEGLQPDGPLTAGPTEPLQEQKVVSEDDAEEEHDTGDDRQCRICFGGADDEDVLGRLISPCLCTGSVRVSCCDASDLLCADDSMSTVSRYMVCRRNNAHGPVKCINAWRGTGTNAVSSDAAT